MLISERQRTKGNHHATSTTLESSLHHHPNQSNRCCLSSLALSVITFSAHHVLSLWFDFYLSRFLFFDLFYLYFDNLSHSNLALFGRFRAKHPPFPSVRSCASNTNLTLSLSPSRHSFSSSFTLARLSLGFVLAASFCFDILPDRCNPRLLVAVSLFQLSNRSQLRERSKININV